jgi:hypothetical protein
VKVWAAAVIVPLRAAPGFGAVVNCTGPDPLPLAPAVTLIHGALATAVHVHDWLVVTVNDPEPPPAGVPCEVGEIENAQPFAWTIVNVCPAIVAVPRRSPSAFAATANCTVPFPDPLLPEEILIHAAPLVAVHGHPPAAVTVTDTVPPVLATF